MKKELLALALAFGCSVALFADGDCKDCPKGAPKDCPKGAPKDCPKECKKDKPPRPRINFKELKQKYPTEFAEIEKLRSEGRDLMKEAREKQKAADAKLAEVLAKEGIELPKRPERPEGPRPPKPPKEPAGHPEAAK